MNVKSNIFDDLFIFEMANNHNGDVKLAIKIIESIASLSEKHQINAAVKLQYRDMATFVHPEYRERKDIRQIPRFFDTDLPKEDYKKIIDSIKSKKLLSIVTPFDEKSVSLCEEHGVDAIKIASCGCDDWPLLETVAAIKKPVVSSFGAHILSQIDEVYDFWSNKGIPFAMLHCIAAYPVKDLSFQLDFIDTMIQRYPGAAIGYSGHEDPNNHLISQIAAAKGARIFERHVGIATDTVSLNSYSLDEAEMEKWVLSIKYVRSVCALSVEEKTVSKAEQETMLALKRGVYVKKPFKKGETITLDDVFYAIPCMERYQLNSSEFRKSIVASKDYGINDALTEKLH